MLKKLALIILFLVLGHAYTQAQDATIYFYRKAKFKGSLITYKVRIDSTIVGEMTPGQVLYYNVTPGRHRIWAKTESEQELYVDIQPGRTYFIECDLTIGVLVGTPSIRQRPAVNALVEIKKINPNLKVDAGATATDYTPSVSDLRSDTLAAVSHLFQRKRKAGNGWGLFFTANTVWILASGGGVWALEAAPLAVIGLVNGAKYSRPKLEVLVNSYQSGKPLSSKIKKKLREKDFK